jgi:hypothetical protein
MSVSIIRDLRAGFGDVRDQGSRPTCLAFAASDTHAALFQPFQPFSVEYLYYHAVRRSFGQDLRKGITANAAADALLNDGQPYESQWPYQNTPAAALSIGSPPDTFQVFRRNLPIDGKSFDQICVLVEAGHPVLLCIRISESFYMPDLDGLVERKTSDPDTGNHAVIAVGHGKTAKENCLLLRNSWGPTWGIGGHAFVGKSYLESRLILTSVII